MKTVVVGTLALIFIGACSSSSPPVAASSPSPALSASPSPVAEVNPAASPAASPDLASPLPVADLPPFKCADQSGNGWPGPGTAKPITEVRTGQQTGYDRFVLQFSTAVPGYTVKRQSSPSVTTDPKGESVNLAGSAALIVSLNPASSYGSYSGSTDIKTGFTMLREARQIGDFEAVNSWGLGLSSGACFRAFTLSSPARLVVDVQSS
jgi:hypothetical protein